MATMRKPFRETLWFKHGDEEVKPEAETAPIPLPIEDRYEGEVSAADSRVFGLHTGSTEYIKIERCDPTADTVAMSKLVGEMKPRAKIMAIGAGACVLVAAFAMYLVG